MKSSQMKKFKCYDCGNVFEAEGMHKEFIDAVYGPCSKWVAVCPGCGEDASQLKEQAGRSKKGGGAPCGNYDSCSCCGG